MAKRLSKRAKRQRKEDQRRRRREHRRALLYPGGSESARTARRADDAPVESLSLSLMARYLDCSEEEAAESMEMLFESGILRPDGRGGIELLS